MRVQSFNWLKVEPAGHRADTIARSNNENQAILNSIANSYRAPLNHIDRPHLSEQKPFDDSNKNPSSLSMIVDTQNAKIFIIPTEAYSAAHLQTRQQQFDDPPQGIGSQTGIQPIEIVEDDPSAADN